MPEQQPNDGLQFRPEFTEVNYIPSVDDETRAIGVIITAMGPLDPEARERVARWAFDRFSRPATEPGAAR